MLKKKFTKNIMSYMETQHKINNFPKYEHFKEMQDIIVEIQEKIKICFNFVKNLQTFYVVIPASIVKIKKKICGYLLNFEHKLIKSRKI